RGGAGGGGAVRVAYATWPGAATAGSDYASANGTLSWADGEGIDKSFTVTIAADSVAEGPETVNLALSGPTGGATLGAPNTAVLTILDSAGTLQFSNSSYAVREDGIFATIVVTRAA